MDKHDVAVVVIARAPGVDRSDATSRLEAAVRRLLRDAGPLIDDTHPRASTGETMPVALVMDAGMAVGNGYLWIEPTGKAARERGLTGRDDD